MIHQKQTPNGLECITNLKIKLLIKQYNNKEGI